jgi:DNA-binding CsgD family transcriptional regulator
MSRRGPGARFTQAEFDRIAEMRERGLSYAQIARKFDCSAKAITWHCLRMGVEPPKRTVLQPQGANGPAVVKRGDHVVRRFTAAEDALLLQLEGDGVIIAEIARRLDRRANSIRGRLYTLARYEARREEGQAA